MNLSLTQQEILAHVRKHSDISTREVFEYIGEMRDLSIIALHNELAAMERLGAVVHSHKLGVGDVWCPAGKMARA